jgi:hypothetical protein
MEHRPATEREIAASYREGQRVSFEHWVRETYNPRARNGVSHRTVTRAKVRLVNGVPSVVYLGDLYPLKATHYTLPGGKTFIASPTIR